MLLGYYCYDTIVHVCICPAIRCITTRCRYVKPTGQSAVPLPEEMQHHLEMSIQEGNCPPTLFTDALAFIISTLQEDFRDHFPTSTQFEILRRELEEIDNKMIAFFHEDPTEFLIHDEEDIEPSLFQRMSFWQK